MDDTLRAIWANTVYRRLILSVIVSLASMMIRRLLHLLLVNRLSDDSPHIYVVRKVTGYAVNALAVFLIVSIWIELGLIYPVDTDSRRTFRSEVSQRILADFATAGIVVASQTVSIVQFPSTLPQGQRALAGSRPEQEQMS